MKTSVLRTLRCVPNNSLCIELNFLKRGYPLIKIFNLSQDVLFKMEVDCFKEEFKRYKKRSTDLRDVLDFRYHDYKDYKVELRQYKPSPPSEECNAAKFGLRPPSEWSIFSLPTIPGLLILPDLFLYGGQHYWVKRCLVDYPCKPNICNLDAHMERSGNGSLWPETLLDQPCNSNTFAAPESKKMKLSSMKKEGFKPISKESPLYRLRWVTLGYHYNWSTKEYNSDFVSPFPEDLGNLSSYIVHHAGFPGFKAEAAIVNYYHLDSSLSGHTDHSEKDLTRPLLSISFGQSAIFLIGGKSKCIKPIPIRLNSGDVVIMSGDARLAYHGVPRILAPSGEAVVPACLTACAMAHSLHHSDIKLRADEESECHKKERTCENTGSGKCDPDGGYCDHSCHHELVPNWSDFVTYLSMSRINVNVRQVVSDQHKF